MIGQAKVRLTLANTGIELTSIPLSGKVVNDLSPFFSPFESLYFDGRHRVMKMNKTLA